MSGLVLLAPHVFVEDVTVTSIAAARDAYVTTDLRERLGRYHDDVDATFRGWNDVWLSPAFRAWDITDRLPAIDVPVLLVQGADDAFGTGRQLDAIAAGVRGPCTRVVVDGVGHAPHLEAPDVTLDAITDFAAGHARRLSRGEIRDRPRSVVPAMREHFWARTIAVTAVLAVGGIAMAACGSDDDDDTAASPSASAAAAATGATAAAASDATVEVMEIEGVGTVLTDAAGQVLYTTDEEAADPDVVCVDDCEEFWSPLVAAAPPAAVSDTISFALAARPDGSQQVTFEGRRLYTFTQEGPGQAQR